MRYFISIICAFLLLIFASKARSETYDAARDFGCAEAGGAWFYEGYRAEDGAYLPMTYGHAGIREVSKYGIEARYIPDSGQEYYPFITRFTDYLVGSPCTVGKGYDAVLTWAAPGAGEVTVSGFARLMGNIRGEAEGKNVKALVKLNDKVVWEADVPGGETREFELKTAVAQGDRLRLHLRNAGDETGDVTAFNMRVQPVNK